jgi:hypothetical protein
MYATQKLLLGKMQSPDVPYSHVRHLPIRVIDVAVAVVTVVTVEEVPVEVTVVPVLVVVDVVGGSLQRWSPS